jgi:hypothetical protein
MLRSFSFVFLLVAVMLAPAPALAQQAPPSGSPTTTDWFQGPNATGDPTLSGTVDPQGAPNTLSGWVVDTSAQGWSGIDDVQVFNGLMDAGGQMVAHPTIQINRPDVAAALNNPYWAASGWSGNLAPSPYGPGGVFFVYAHTPSKGWWYQMVTTTLPPFTFRQPPHLDIEQPTPLATVHANAPYTIRGSAYDPAASPAQGTGVDRVQVYLNGDRQSGIFIGDATLGQRDQFSAQAGPQFANAGWSLQFQPNSWFDTVIDNTQVQMTVYARSSVTGPEMERRISIIVSIP